MHRSTDTAKPGWRLLTGRVAVVALSLAYPAIRQHATAQPVRAPAQVKEEMFVRIGGIDQWITLTGDDRKNPVVLFLHGGPGDAASPFAEALFRKWKLAYQAKIATAPPAPITRSPAYASPEERVRYAAADDFSFAHFKGLTMSGPMQDIDLPRLGTDFEIPIFIVQGQEDRTAIPELAKAYFDSIKAPRKQFYLVPGAGHEPSTTQFELTLKVLTEQVRPLALERH